jgi:lipoprotein-anchoring transpeptidase ErfK/SrfK
MGGYYWIRFYKDYLFHSVPFDKNNNMIQEEYNKLGTPASHGCIRLEVENARWLYEKLPHGVKVIIY